MTTPEEKAREILKQWEDAATAEYGAVLPIECWDGDTLVKLIAQAIAKQAEVIAVMRSACMEIMEMSVHKEREQVKKNIFRDWRDIAREALAKAEEMLK